MSLVLGLEKMPNLRFSVRTWVTGRVSIIVAEGVRFSGSVCGVVCVRSVS